MDLYETRDFISINKILNQDNNNNNRINNQKIFQNNKINDLIEKEKDNEFNRKLYEVNFNINDAFNHIMTTNFNEESIVEGKKKSTKNNTARNKKKKTTKYDSGFSPIKQTDLMELGINPNVKPQLRILNNKKDQNNKEVNYPNSNYQQNNDIISRNDNSTETNHIRLGTANPINHNLNFNKFILNNQKSSFFLENNKSLTKLVKTQSMIEEGPKKILSIKTNSNFFSYSNKNSGNIQRISNLHVSNFNNSNENNFYPIDKRNTNFSKFLIKNKDNLSIDSYDKIPKLTKDVIGELNNNIKQRDIHTSTMKKKNINLAIFNKDKIMLKRYESLKENFFNENYNKNSDSSSEEKEKRFKNSIKTAKNMKKLFKENKNFLAKKPLNSYGIEPCVNKFESKIITEENKKHLKTKYNDSTHDTIISKEKNQKKNDTLTNRDNDKFENSESKISGKFKINQENKIINNQFINMQRIEKFQRNRKSYTADNFNNSRNTDIKKINIEDTIFNDNKQKSEKKNRKKFEMLFQIKENQKKKTPSALLELERHQINIKTNESLLKDTFKTVNNQKETKRRIIETGKSSLNHFQYFCSDDNNSKQDIFSNKRPSTNHFSKNIQHIKKQEIYDYQSQTGQINTTKSRSLNPSAIKNENKEINLYYQNDTANNKKFDNMRNCLYTPFSNNSSTKSNLLINSISNIEKKTKNINRSLNKNIKKYRNLDELSKKKEIPPEQKCLKLIKNPKSLRRKIVMIPSSVEEKKKNLINLSENTRSLLKMADFIESMNNKIVLKLKNEIESQYRKAALKNGLINLNEILQNKYSKIENRKNNLKNITIETRRLENSILNTRNKIEEKHFSIKERENLNLKNNVKIKNTLKIKIKI